MNDIITKGPFMGREKDTQSSTGNIGVNPGLGLGVNPRLGLYKEILDYYSTLHFIKADGSYNLETVVSYTTNILIKHGLVNTNDIQQCAGIWIYPKEYFCPMDILSKKLHKTDKTHSIHHFNGSWLPLYAKINLKIKQLIGKKMTCIIQRGLANLKNI